MARFLAWVIIFIMWIAFWVGITAGIGFLITGTLDCWKMGFLAAFWTSPMITVEDF